MRAFCYSAWRVADDTTRRLVETAGSSAAPLTTAIRWTLPDAPTVVTPLVRKRQTIGRGEAQDIRLDASGVSRLHAELVLEGPVYALRDCGSTNGTYVNRQRTEHTALSPGDVLRLGDAIGVVVRQAPEIACATDVASVDGFVFGPGSLEVLSTLRRAGPTGLPVVVVGETGTGKEAVARSLHHFSGRTGPFHAINCAALPSGLAEAELFGYRKGAFTGAEQPAQGYLRAAHLGTLFLDELADLPLPTQAKLLRALQLGEVMPLGESRPVRVDVRLISAVQTPLDELVAERRLRQDLAMRLQGLVLKLPPLRERREDIPVLFRHFLQLNAGGRAPSVEPRLLECLMCADWPGNVRELEFLARQLVALHGHDPVLRKSMLPPAFANAVEVELPSTPAATNRKEHDLTRLKAELSANGGNLARAAAAVGISRSRAYRILGARGRPEGTDDDGRGG